MFMIRMIVIFGVFLAGCAVFAGQGPQPPATQPPATQAPVTQPPAAQPPAAQSPAIILPPQNAQSGTTTPAPAADKTQTPDKSPKGKGNPSQAKPKDPTAVGPAYVIGPEDALYIRVWQQPELSGQVRVGPDGTISLQLIGEVMTSGLTPNQLEQELVKRFQACCLKEPEVNVQVVAVNSRTYIIEGDGVNRPGIFPLTRPMTVQEALIAGSGFSPFANKKKIYVLRGGKKFYFNWNDVTKGKHLEQNILIQNGDQIYVP
jgi:polysaccharide export outer membrane protein